MAQPLLDLLGRNASFFVAHNATAADVVALAIALTLLVPLVIAAVVLAIRRISPGIAAALHACVLTLLGAVLVLVVLQRSGASARIPGVVAVLAALLAGLVVPLAYSRMPGLRRGLVLMAWVAPIVAGTFVFASPARALVFREPPADAITSIGQDAPPIVMVVFDELPLASLLRRDGTVDADAFPNFARFANDATWFRNSSTVHGQSSDAIPAALTGLYPDPDKLPLASDHPGNLFALLSGTYDLNVVEPLTELCPPGQCPRPVAESENRLRTLVTDLAVVTAHLVLPPDLTASLPPIDQGWTNFRDSAQQRGKDVAFRDRFRAAREDHPAAPFEQFVDDIERRDRPTLDFIHVLLPHSPWKYAADGREYDETTQRPGIEYGVWVADPWAVAQGYQRHLVQTQLSDRLLGQLLDRLESEGIYDDAAVVVMADHGASFTPTTSLRTITRETFPEIGVVPFLIKPPGQTEGTVSDRPVEIIDVLPTVLDVIDADPPDGIDGISAFDGDAPARTVKTFYGPFDVFEFEPTLDDVWPIVERKDRIFGAAPQMTFPFGLAPRGAGALLGTPAPAGLPPVPGLTVALENDEMYADVDNTLPTVPAWVSGVLAGPTPVRPAVAIAVNGTVQAITLADSPEPAGRRFRALLPPDVLRDGANTIEVFLLDDQGALVPLTLAP